MKAAKLFSILVFAIIGIYGAVGLYFLPMAGFEGDLTRVGKMPESLFGWTKPQPAIAPELLRPASWEDADVLVIGDSFSETRVWQSVLVKHGLRVRTYHWTSIVGGICEDFYPWVRSQGFKGKWIIFEVVERNVEGGFAKSVACKKQEFHPSAETNRMRQPPIISRLDKDISGRLSVGIETWLNAMHYDRLSTQPSFVAWDLPGDALIQRVPNGCKLFSHSRCQDALFYNADQEPDIGDTALDNIDILNKRLGNLTPIWVFIPNKSTVFLHPEKQFWNKAEKRFNAPNILKLMREALERKTIDLYPGNNSHISTEGYLLLGESIHQNLLASKHLP